MSSRWAYALGAPRARGQLRTDCADFYVEEVAAFTPSGDGEHDYLWIEKTDLTTVEVARRLAAAADIRVAAVGYAGLKDRRAVTRQWFSVHRPGMQNLDWRFVSDSGLRVLRQERHRRKLKRGAHRGNRFRIVVRDVDAHAETIGPRLQSLALHGMPNYFGEQRFGRDERNIAAARQLFDGRRLPRTARSLALSAARAWIFNDVLSERVSDGTWAQFIDGDVAGLDGTASVFVVEDLDALLEKRLADGDVHPTGPLWGAGRNMTRGAAATVEQGAADRHAELARGLIAMTKMARRVLRARVRALEWQRAGNTLTLEFGLDRGQYATVLLREVANCSPRAAAGHGER